MKSLILVDGIDLALWSNRRDSQGQMPRLIRRLIHATVQRAFRVGFAAGEGVALGGWDGIVVVEEGNSFVPSGTSAWEMGVNKDIKGKADDDYEKRRLDPKGIDPAQSTFVFVTPRRWGGKDDWVTARQSEGVWREVRAYDADDLEDWLDLAPAVHVWLSILLGKHPENVMDLESFWNDWSEMTRPSITSEFVLSGRNETFVQVREWLSNAPTPLAIQAETRDEALAVFAAVLQKLPEEERIIFLSRVVLVYDFSAWLRLISSDESLVLIPVFDSRDVLGRAVRNGHQVVIPLGRADSKSRNTLSIPRLSKEEAAKALIDIGMAEKQAQDLAKLARRSIQSFRRKLAISPEVQQPEWARPAEASSLLVPMLVGSWNDSIEGDRQAISTLAQTSYDEVCQVYVRWSNESDPPLRHIGDSWFIVSREDAWLLLERYLTRIDLERFEALILEVLSTPDPRFDLPVDRRWMAGTISHTPRYSSLIRKGLAETLAVMGVRGSSTQISTGVTARDYVKWIIRRLFEIANTDWRIWASLSHLLSLLAEAAPDQFLAAVEGGLSGEQPVLIRLFTDQEDSLFSSSPHTGLLWALETLSWSPEHLGRSALLLAKLAKLDPGGKLANRPKNSLREIFIPWHPHTTATLIQRLRVLDVMRQCEPEVSWQLLSKLLPKNYDSVGTTAKPRWQDWINDTLRDVTQTEYIRAIREMVSRMLTDVNMSGYRWKDLIEALPLLPIDQYKAVVQRLMEVNVDDLRPIDKANIWDALRTLLSRHRSFPDADWALQKEWVDHLSEVFKKFEPKEATARYGWLFSNQPNLPEGRERSWDEKQKALNSARLEAVIAIHLQSGINGILQLVGCVERPEELGHTLGRSELLKRGEVEFLCENLASDDTLRAQFTRGFILGRVSCKGREWGEALYTFISEKLSPLQRAEFLICLPTDGRTCDMVEKSGSDTERQFWSLVSPYWVKDIENIERSARKFLENNRPFTAVDFLAIHIKHYSPLPVNLIADALECTLRTSPDNETPTSSFSYHVSELLEVLEASDEIDENRVAALEWAFLPLLGRKERTPKILHRELARNPNFFAEIVALVYRAEGEEPRESTEQEQARAGQGDELLKSWRTVPGKKEDGSIDLDTLKEWIKNAQKATSQISRRVIGDHIIGEVLSASPVGTDGAWPHEAVRDVIEEASSIDLERGFEIGLYNRRGVVTKRPYEGGIQERKLAEKYNNFAVAINDQWLRTAAMLRRIAEKYSSEAQREDQRAELGEDLER